MRLELDQTGDFVLDPAFLAAVLQIAGILLPVALFIVVNTVSLYRQALRAADTAYDRTLLASAKSIGEQLQVEGAGDAARVLPTVPYSALEAFEADNRSRMFFKVSGFQGEMVSGFDDLPAWRGKIPDKGIYAALVDFYDDTHRGQAVRVALVEQRGVEAHAVAGDGRRGARVAARHRYADHASRPTRRSWTAASRCPSPSARSSTRRPRSSPAGPARTTSATRGAAPCRRPSAAACRGTRRGAGV